MRYDPATIEPKWQAKWAEDRIYETTETSDKPKRYVLEYFPYPSGAAMHVGHVRNYTIGDVVARHARMQGINVLHPMGWDAFGLPAENYAIKNNISPQTAIAENTAKFKQQLSQMGFSYDWSREINSSDPSYYKWTQWFFKLLFERGLAYQKDSLQWWCETDKTVLANEQVEAGKCWRCGNPVTKKPLKQWFFKITDYADRLSEDLDKVDWSESIKSMQRNWIGKSKGAEVDFELEHKKGTIRVFTTRPDTLYGATFMVLAPEHPLVAEITTDEQRQTVEAYVKLAQTKSDVERQETDREKTGVFTGAHASNPLTGELVPVWVADYVLMGYGTGAIMAVPAHDERDYAFANKFGLPITQVIAQTFNEPLPNAKRVTGVNIIGYDPETNRYMSMRNNRADKPWLAGGGKNDDETYDEAALRELTEEAGYKNVTKLIPLGGFFYTFYYNRNKDSNRCGTGQNYLAIISEKETPESHNEEHEDFTPEWQDYETLVEKFDGFGEGSAHWLEAIRQARFAAEQYVKGEEYDMPLFTGDGILVNSGPFDDTPSAEARELIVQHLEREGSGKEVTNYKIRDWLISRQRYWGAPIPVVHCPEHGAVAVPDNQLPVVLPEVESYQPTGAGTSVLAGVTDWVNTTCPTCGGPAKRETDTMDGFACSSWYFLRFTDPHNDEAPFAKEKAEFWAPVDDYIGGAEHAVMHLLYARMWTKVMFDAGMISFDEPFTSLRNQGMILAPDGRKMSKSWGNTITPDDIISEGYGADAIRVMELFIGPWDQSANWSVEGMGGCYRFLNRVWTLVQEYLKSDKTGEVPLSVTHRVIKKVSEDIYDMGFNTAISAQMEFVNELYKLKTAGMRGESWEFAIRSLLQLLAPFAPHITEELWSQLGETDSIHLSEWPLFDEALLVEKTLRIVLQVNGKVRATIEVTPEADAKELERLALENTRVQEFTNGTAPKKVIVVPGKLVNVVV
jgi:leucyl-tRNA synthetase